MSRPVEMPPDPSGTVSEDNGQVAHTYTSGSTSPPADLNNPLPKYTLTWLDLNFKGRMDFLKRRPPAKLIDTMQSFSSGTSRVLWGVDWTKPASLVVLLDWSEEERCSFERRSQAGWHMMNDLVKTHPIVHLDLALDIEEYTPNPKNMHEIITVSGSLDLVPPNLFENVDSRLAEVSKRRMEPCALNLDECARGVVHSLDDSDKGGLRVVTVLLTWKSFRERVRFVTFREGYFSTGYDSLISSPLDDLRQKSATVQMSLSRLRLWDHEEIRRRGESTCTIL